MRQGTIKGRRDGAAPANGDTSWMQGSLDFSNYSDNDREDDDFFDYDPAQLRRELQLKRLDVDRNKLSPAASAAFFQNDGTLVISGESPRLGMSPEHATNGSQQKSQQKFFPVQVTTTTNCASAAPHTAQDDKAKLCSLCAEACEECQKCSQCRTAPAAATLPEQVMRRHQDPPGLAMLSELSEIESGGPERGIPISTYTIGSTLRLQHELATSVSQLGRPCRSKKKRTIQLAAEQNSSISQQSLQDSQLHLVGETGNTRDGTKMIRVGRLLSEEESKLLEVTKPPALLSYRMQKETSIVKRISREDIRLVYTMQHVIGSGNFGTARLAYKTANKEKKFAVKSIQRKRVEADLNLLEAELDILLAVDHPHICTFYEAYLDHKYVHLVMEYCPGGELYSMLEREGSLREDFSRTLIQQSLRALKHLHDMGVVHRDLKPENILFDSNYDVKMIDFGMSKILQNENSLMDTKLGTPYYVSPEVLQGKYDKGCDMWSIGVITFVLLSGEPPFHGKNAAELFKKIKTCDFDFVQPAWQSISREAKRFIIALIEPNIQNRLTVEQALNHPWMINTEQTVTVDAVSAKVFARLKHFGSPKRLKMEILMMLVSLIDDQLLFENKKAFSCIDTDHSGTVSQDEVRTAISQINVKFPEIDLAVADVEELFTQKLGLNADQDIPYSQFLAATLTQNHLKTASITQLFNYLDIYETKSINKDTLLKTFERKGRSLSEDEVTAMLHELGFDTDVNIDYVQFEKLILDGFLQV